MTAASTKNNIVDHPAIETAQMEQLLQLQRDVLEMIAQGRPGAEILDRLCRLSEAMVPNSVASIMLLDESGNELRVRSAPSIPAAAIGALNGLRPGPRAGSCGTAVFQNQPVFVENVLTDPRWEKMLDLAARFNLQACWSMPIRIANDQLVGSFALSSFECRPPSAFHRRLLDTASYLAGIVLDREDQGQRLQTAAVAFEHMHEAVMVTDAEHRIVQVNRAFERITGYTADETIGQTPRLLHSGRQSAEFYRRFYSVLERDDEWAGEIWNRRKNGEIYPQRLSIRTVRNGEGQVCKRVSVFADITEHKESERKLWQLAHHDALTDLPNRLLLVARLEHAIQRAHRTDSRLALLFIDLDRFKNVNDSLGHQAGDELLQGIAGRLLAAVHEDDTVARLGGDEFVIVLDDVPDAAAVRRIAERIIERLAEPMMVRGKSLIATASVGISLYPEDASEAEALLQHADAAMYRAKSLGRNQLAFYAPELTEAVQQRLDLEHDMRRGLANGEFEMHYQPQFTAADGRLVAVEALLRWNHPERGAISPAVFIPVAEETGLIQPLGCWATETACREAESWLALAPDITLAVNLSPYQLRGDCSTGLNEIFERTGFPASSFEFEVTESLLLEAGGDAVQQLATMRDRFGVRIAMDDFGTGHSSLGQLKLLPISKLKIDRSFVNDLPDDPNDVAIVRTIIAMAHTLGLDVVAEGVETDAQHRFLRENGCDHLQGFLYHRPMPAADFTRLLHDGLLGVRARPIREVDL